MEQLKSFKALIQRLPSLPYSAGIYVRPDEWDVSPGAANFFLFFEDDEEEDDFDEKIESMDLVELCRRATLEDVVVAERRHRPSASEDELLAALLHYLEFDDFRT